MENFNFYNPVRIIFGKNIVPETGHIASTFGKKALFVYGRSSIKKNGVYDAIVKTLKENH